MYSNNGIVKNVIESVQTELYVKKMKVHDGCLAQQLRCYLGHLRAIWACLG